MYPPHGRGRSRLGQPVLGEDPSVSRLSVLIGLTNCGPPQREGVSTHRLRDPGLAIHCTVWINVDQNVINAENLAAGRHLGAHLFVTFPVFEGEELRRRLVN